MRDGESTWGRRTTGLTLLALVTGAIAGLATSKARWGYVLGPPSTAVRRSMEVDSVSFVAVRGTRRPLTVAEQKTLLEDQLRRCAASGEDCSFGRVLLRTGTKAWLGLVRPDDAEAEVAIDRALALRAAPFALDPGPTLGMVARLHERGRHLVIVGLQSRDSTDDDYHGYAEWLMDEHGHLDDFAVYYFDVAGLEFATPSLLAGAGALACSLPVLLLLIAVRGFGCRRWRRSLGGRGRLH